MKKTAALIALLILFFWGFWLHFYRLESWPEQPERLIQVHIEGCVAAPGVYTLPHTARLASLLEAAGGLTDEADPQRINLARRLMDGEKLVIPAAAAAEGETPAQPAACLPLDEQSWLAVPGIGPATAEKIVDYLRDHPAAALDDLLAVSGIGPAKLERIKEYFQQ